MKWFTADPHFDHEGIIRMCGRPFGSAAEMNRVLVETINKYVKKSDSLYILGDFGWAGGGKAEAHRRLIVCKNVHFIRGNHDRTAFDKMFTSAQDVKEVKLRGRHGEKHKAWLSHYPHAIWPGSHRGSLHLYGHTHWQREPYLDEVLRDHANTMVFRPHRRSMDVGVDSAYRFYNEYRPFSEEEVIDLIGKRIGHHNVEVERYWEERLNRRTS